MSSRSASSSAIISSSRPVSRVARFWPAKWRRYSSKTWFAQVASWAPWVTSLPPCFAFSISARSDSYISRLWFALCRTSRSATSPFAPRSPSATSERSSPMIASSSPKSRVARALPAKPDLVAARDSIQTLLQFLELLAFHRRSL